MYDRILVPVDGSPTAELGLAEAIGLATLTHARLRLVHVVDLLASDLEREDRLAVNPALVELLRQRGQQVLARAKAKAMEAGLLPETALLEMVEGRVSERLAEEAQAWQADLVVIGTHGRRGIGRLLLGSDAEQLLRLARVPVLLVRARGAAG